MKTIKNEDLIIFETFFDNIRDGGLNEGKIKDFTSLLSKIFGKSFSLHIIPESENKSFGLSITPDKKTIEDISKKIIKGNEDSTAIISIWKKCNCWTIQIDERLLNHSFTSRELSSLLIHEICHILESDDTPKRVFDTVQYKLACNPCEIRSLAKKSNFGSVLSLPIIQACCYDNSVIDLRKEIKTNEFFKDNISYTDSLISCMNKIDMKSIGKNELEDTSNLSINTLTNLKDGNIKTAKDELIKFKENLPDNTEIKKCCESVIENMFIKNYSKYIINENVALENVKNDIDSIIETGYITEFLGFGKEKMVPITQNQIDYVEAKSQAIESVDDKVMLISYINSKLDMIRYYLEIMNNPKMAKKFIIPNSESQLIRFNNQLIRIKKYVMNYKIPEKRDELVVWYPKGYEG